MTDKIAVLTAISVFCHINYAYIYRLLSTKVDKAKSKKEVNGIEHYLSIAILLYTFAAIFIGVAIFICYLLYGCDFDISKGNILNQFQAYNLLIPLFIMAILYSLHITTEAYAIGKYKTASYMIFFQFSIIVTFVWDWYFKGMNRPIAINDKLALIGQVIISIVALINFSKVKSEKQDFSFFSKNSLIALISAFCCGSGIFIDSEFAENVIFVKLDTQNHFVPYLVYELLTFLLPVFLVYLFYIKKFGIKRSCKVFEIFKKNKLLILLSSFFSAGQFVFAIYSLGQSENKIMPITIIALTGFASTIYTILLDFIINTFYKKNKFEINKQEVIKLLILSIFSLFTLKHILSL